MSQKIKKLLLEAIFAEGGDAYSISITKYLALHGVKMQIGNLYFKLEALEKEGYVTHKDVPGGTERGFRDKRVWFLTLKGASELYQPELEA